MPLAIGADGGDSICIPSSLCGVVGLKPTYDLVCSKTRTPTLVKINAISTKYLNCLKQRTRSCQSLFEEVDIIIAPTTGCTAPKIDPRSLSHGSVSLFTC